MRNRVRAPRSRHPSHRCSTTSDPIGVRVGDEPQPLRWACSLLHCTRPERDRRRRGGEGPGDGARPGSYGSCLSSGPATHPTAHPRRGGEIPLNRAGQRRRRRRSRGESGPMTATARRHPGVRQATRSPPRRRREASRRACAVAAVRRAVPPTRSAPADAARKVPYGQCDGRFSRVAVITPGERDAGSVGENKNPGSPLGGGAGAAFVLGYLDSNQEQRNQKPPCCQLHHTPRL